MKNNTAVLNPESVTEMPEDHLPPEKLHEMPQKLRAVRPVPPEQEYRVSWEIDVTAPSAREAARLARQAQRPGTWASTFVVQPAQDDLEDEDAERFPNPWESITSVTVSLEDEIGTEMSPAENATLLARAADALDTLADTVAPRGKKVLQQVQVDELVRDLWNAVERLRNPERAYQRLEARYAIANALEALRDMRDGKPVPSSFWKTDGVGATALEGLESLKEQI